MANIQELLESGVHFGHLTRKWNPNMAPYIYTERNGVHIIDLYKTSAKIDVVKNSLKKRLFKFSLKDSSIKTPLYQLTKLTMHIENRIGRRTILTNFFEAINRSSFSETGFIGNLSLVPLNK